MCGIFGLISKASKEQLKELDKRGHEAQVHRGPDMSGSQIIELRDDYRLALGHQRLSILDLSESGRQPMVAKNGNSTICYNGEVYNYIEIAEAIGLPLKGDSDTRVILESFVLRGVAASLETMNGMWAFIYYDEKSDKVFLARDRTGEKPLYYFQDENGLYFASEVKTILAMTQKKFKVNRQSVGLYIDQSLQDIDESSWFEGIKSVKPAHYVEISLADGALKFNEVCYWKPSLIEKPISEEQAVKEVKKLVEDAVRIRLRSDVPLGITLSGGVDSSINAALLSQYIPSNTIKAFSSISPGQSGDESYFVDSVSKALKIPTVCMDLSWKPEETEQLIRMVTWHNDAPLGSFSNISFFRLMEAARKHGIKVVISGQGADEVFCGYKKYFFWSLREDIRKGKILRATTSILLALLKGTIFNQFKLSEAKRYLYRGPKRESILSESVKKSYFATFNSGVGINGKQLNDISKFSVPFLTHYEDRGSMAHGVEVRLPFLDHRIIEAGLSYPKDLKIKGPWTKYVLRKAFEDIVPSENIWRRDKQGFSSAQEDLMRGPLSSLIESVFMSESLIYKLDLIDKSKLIELWRRFLAGDSSVWYREIFAPWALEIWLQEFQDSIFFES